MLVFKIIIATLIFALIQLYISSKANLIAAVVANIPVFTMFAFVSVSSGQDLRKMALYLSIMTLVISLSYLIVYLANISAKQVAVVVFGVVWGILTVIAYLLLRRVL
ncbi:hypothetical protein Hipma_0674 [Hippea maritima DSM 10411]|uniref:Uncharacterized protein n=2 Tax=Hippea TaxID=84404 RepID=F2LV60_HIPMA|nr:hypothetical protein Hipma_0674 [Hippea maritima DSM 10411]